jgi:hypothetical protein
MSDDYYRRLLETKAEHDAHGPASWWRGCCEKCRITNLELAVVGAYQAGRNAGLVEGVDLARKAES